MGKDRHGNECSKRIPIHIRTLALPKFNYNKSIEFAEKLYGSIGVYFDIQSGLCMALSKANSVKLAVIDGTCKWDQNNSEQDDLYKLAGLSRSDGVIAFIVGGIKQPSGSGLNGCAGHEPDKPAFVVSANASNFTLAHELGHVLLGPKYSPVHTTSMSNIMFGGGTSKIPSTTSPTFDAKQTAQILKSSYLKDY